MADVNRWDHGDKNCIGVTVLSGTTVEMGDLMFLDDTDGLREEGSSTADYTAYPVEHLRPTATLSSNKGYIETRFLGVAMEGKDGGVNQPEKLIAIARSGIFEFDMKPARTVKVGYYAGPSGTTSASNFFNQKVMVEEEANKTHCYGHFVEYKTHAQSALVMIKTRYYGGMIS